MGRSARPPFTIKAKKDDIKGRVEQAESFFIDSLEEWREQMGLGRMTLIGHSLGAYFSVAYALKYPDRVHKLILLSPAGVTRGPNWTDPSREIADESTAHPGASPTFQQATKDQVKKIEQDQKDSQQVSRTRRLLIYLWERGWSPFQLLRSTLFWSPLLIGKYTSRRFPSLTPSEIRDMHEYLTNITLSKGSGEYCISHILAPWAWAHMPLVDRIAMLPREMPVTFVYGDQDWMDPVGGFESVEKLRQAGNPNGKMYIITDAGHHGKSISYKLLVLGD
jgi:cardiolipin-specific phospholipase